MLIKYFKLLIFTLLLFFQSPLYSINTNNKKFNSNYLSNYFSALVSYNNKKNQDALKFFNSSKSIIDKHQPYLKKYIFSLVIEGKIKQAIKYLKYNLDNKNSNFFEFYLLLTIDSINKKDFDKSIIFLKDLQRFKDNGATELAIYETLRNLVFLFQNKKISIDQTNFGNFSIISNAFQNCYLEEELTDNYFKTLIGSNESDNSRYIFFYVNYLISQNKYKEAIELTNKVDSLNSSLLVSQTKKWINAKKVENFEKFFSCKNETNIISELFFLIANIYSTQTNFEKSNFYLNISNFLNPKFHFNLTLLAENYYINEDYIKTKKILNNFNKDDDVYHWYKVKKKASIISKESSNEKSLEYINLNFQKINNPSIKILFDMGNINKNFKKFETAIDYYNKVLLKINVNSSSYADILYRRGASYERLKNYKKSDNDLLKSLKINPDDAYVLNYLAYSWLERDYKINTAIKMLEKAHAQKRDDPFILDSVGWAYYLVGDLIKAEEFLKKAIELMPEDPIVNDHYGDILWKLERKIQAKYYWQNVLTFEETDSEMKENIYIKLLSGLKKI